MEVISGYMTIKAPTMLKTKTYHDFWCILYTGRGSFSPRIDLYPDKESIAPGNCKKTIYIEEAKWKKVQSLDPAFSFEVKHNKQYIFISNSVAEVREWVLRLCCISKELFDSKQRSGMDSGSLTGNGEEFVVQENVLYTSNNDVMTFNVVADNTEGGCQSFGLNGLYRLSIGNTTIRLLHHESEKELIQWSLHDLRNFGHSSRTVFLHAGSRSKSGAGKFIFHTVQSETIVQCLTQQAERLKNFEKGKDTNHGPVSAALPPPSAVNRPQAPPKPPRLSGGSEADDDELCEYQNVNNESTHPVSMKNRPAPAPPGNPSHSEIRRESVSGIDKKFIKELDSKVGHLQPGESNNHQPLGKSVSQQSAGAMSRKGSKKADKETKKEKKKREEEEKKERKRREEEEKRERKRKEEEEKKREKERKKGKAHKTLSNQSQRMQSADMSHEYATAEYAQADDFKQHRLSAPNGLGVDGDKIYCEPWNLNLLPAPFPTEKSSAAKPPVPDEVVYAQPEKKPGDKKQAIEGREVLHSENYEEVSSSHSGSTAPPIIAPAWALDGDDSNNNIYDHIHGSTEKPVEQENVYGMASASEPFTLTPEENIYEDSGLNDTYDRVG